MNGKGSTRLSADQVMLVGCPVCGSEKGSPCRVPKGYYSSFHHRRRSAVVNYWRLLHRHRRLTSDAGSVMDQMNAIVCPASVRVTSVIEDGT